MSALATQTVRAASRSPQLKRALCDRVCNLTMRAPFCHRGEAGVVIIGDTRMGVDDGAHATIITPHGSSEDIRIQEPSQQSSNYIRDDVSPMRNIENDTRPPKSKNTMQKVKSNIKSWMQVPK
ncbi:unnamed protein product [Owenia fusiformis]|uniref:Uncharacterized protein n=1 Tax=Owenia fusiformis TaxID=6347 RepID=A0A8J1XNV3_OWEFU|nr:unnamed protein product [Owenia fusiformis]